MRPDLRVVRGGKPVIIPMLIVPALLVVVMAVVVVVSARLGAAAVDVSDFEGVSIANRA